LIRQVVTYWLDMRPVVKLLKGFEPSNPETNLVRVVEIMIKQACVLDDSVWSGHELCLNTLEDNFPAMDDYWKSRILGELQAELDHLLPIDQLHRHAMVKTLTRGLGQPEGMYCVKDGQ
jgi:hypothetical protein